MKQIIVLILMVLMGFYTSDDTFADKPTVVSNPWVVDKKISQYDLVRIFTRKYSHWSDGHKITVFIKGMGSIESRIFIMDVLNLTPYKYQSIVDSVVYSGEATPPIELSSDDEMIRNLSKTPYSIGYVNYAVMINIDHQLTIINYE